MPAAPTPMPRIPVLTILGALVLGIAAGIALGASGITGLTALTDGFEAIGSLWLNGLRMTIVPLIVALVITGITRTAEAARAGRLSAMALGSITAIMALSATVGMAATPLLLELVPLPDAARGALRHALGSSAHVPPPPPFLDMIRGLVPTNVIDSAARTDILPLLIFTLIFAFATSRLAPDPRQRITGLFEAIADALVIAVGWVLRLAPIGVFALALVVGARSGTGVIGTLVHYVLIVSAVGGIMLLLAYPLAVFGGGLRLGAFARALVPVQALALSTQSSLACLPIMLAKSQELGVPEPRAALVLPMAVALLRATGPAMNVAVALYIAHLFDVPVSAGHAMIGIGVATLASLGSISLPGSITFLANIAPICLALGIPIEPLALFVAIETLPDLMRTTGNVTMDVALTASVSNHAGERDALS